MALLEHLMMVIPCGNSSVLTMYLYLPSAALPRRGKSYLRLAEQRACSLGLKGAPVRTVGSVSPGDWESREKEGMTTSSLSLHGGPNTAPNCPSCAPDLRTTWATAISPPGKLPSQNSSSSGQPGTLEDPLIVKGLLSVLLKTSLNQFRKGLHQASFMASPTSSASMTYLPLSCCVMSRLLDPLSSRWVLLILPLDLLLPGRLLLP